MLFNEKPYWKKVLAMRKKLGIKGEGEIRPHELEELKEEYSTHTRSAMMDDRQDSIRAECLAELGLTEADLAEQQQQRRPKEPPKPPDNSRDEQGNDLIMVRPEQQQEYIKWGGR